jgi:hypothetical protein
MARVVNGSGEGNEDQAGWRGVRRVAVPAFARLPAPARKSILHALGKYAPWEDGFDATPPHAEGDEVPGAPDFVGIGAQKSGTTWWYDAICAHPDVYARPDVHKERHFFGRYATRAFGPAEASQYHQWFPRPPGRQAGEWTPDYIHLPWVPPLLARAAPRARLMVLLRDPVDRFRSGLAHQRRDRGRLTVEACQEAVVRGLYHDALRRWLDYFPADQILVLQYERCVADSAEQLARTYRFLQLEPFMTGSVRNQVNTTARTVHLDEDVCHRLVDLYTPDVVALSKLFPDLDLDLWPNFSSGGDD